MKNRFLNIILAAVVVSSIATSCKKDKEEPTPVPQIEFVSITPSTVTEYVDSINIVISYDDYVSYGSEAKVKEAGKMRVEGKNYIVKDGDVMHFRFNV